MAVEMISAVTEGVLIFNIFMLSDQCFACKLQGTQPKRYFDSFPIIPYKATAGFINELIHKIPYVTASNRNKGLLAFSLPAEQPGGHLLLCP